METDDLNNFEGKLKQFEQSSSAEVTTLQEEASALEAATDRVQKSFSGSWIGWHSTVYYGNYEQPPSSTHFNVEWGAVYGLPEGWHRRTSDEVQKAVLNFAGSSLHYPDFKSLKEAVLKKYRAFVEEIRFIAPDHPTSKQQALLDRIEALDLAELKTQYVRGHAPKSIVSRDSSAVLEGIKIPHHVLMAAEAYEGLVMAEAMPELIRLAEQFLRLVKQAPKAQDAVQTTNGVYLNLSLLEEIKNRTTSNGFNTKKLQSLIIELNDNYQRGNYYSVHMLIRALVDHTPPMLACKNFEQVASSYPWTKTDKKYMQKLLDFKLQGDDALHRQISSKEDTINEIDIPPARWLSVLLSECIEKL